MIIPKLSFQQDVEHNKAKIRDNFKLSKYYINLFNILFLLMLILILIQAILLLLKEYYAICKENQFIITFRILNVKKIKKSLLIHSQI